MKINSSNVFLVLLICLIFTDCFSQWYSTLGPEGADVTSLVYTDTVLYIGCSDYGGVFKSTNHGDNWSRIGNIIPSKRDIRTLILKNNVLYVGTFDGILKSTDSGNNWVTSFSGSTVTSFRRR